MRVNVKSIVSIIAVQTLLLICLSASAHALPIPAGQAIVADDDAGTNSDGGLFSVELTPGLPTFGQRTLISDFGDPVQGPVGQNPTGVALDGMGNALVMDESAGTNEDGALFHVICPPFPGAGTRTIISDFGDPAQGPLGDAPSYVVLDGLGSAFVTDDSAGTNGDGALFLINLTTGNRTLLSDFGDPAQGPIGQNPQGVTLDGSGDALVIDEDAGTDFDGALFSVDLTTGNRTIISNFGNPAQGPLGVDPFDVVLDGSGNALVIDDDAGTNGDGALFRVILPPFPGAGNRIIVSDFGNAAQGPLGQTPRGVTLDGSGDALVTDVSAGTNNDGALFSVDLTTGDRTLISNFGNPAQGPLGDDPKGVAFRPPPSLVRNIPTLSEWGLIALVLALGAAGIVAYQRRNAAA